MRFFGKNLLQLKISRLFRPLLRGSDHTIYSMLGYHIAFDRSVEQAAFKAEQFEEIQQLEPRLFEKHFRIVKVAFTPQDLRL